MFFMKRAMAIRACIGFNWRKPIELESHNGGVEPSGLENLMEDVREVNDPRDVNAIRAILRVSLPTLNMSEIAIAEDFLAEHTEFSPRAISTMMKEARNYIPGHGYVHTVDDLMNTYADWLRQTYEAVVFSGTGMYTYEKELGIFEFVSQDELEAHILETFGNHPLCQRVSNVQLMVKRLRLVFNDEEFFADARPGVNLKDGFLAIDADGAPILLPHSPSHKARMQIDVAYDADASFDWLDTALQVTLPSQEARDALQEIAAAILFNITPLKDGVRRMFIFHGARRSGKSTLINVLESLLPSSAVSSVAPEHWSNPNYLTALENALLNTLTELGSQVKISGEHLKKIVSWERIMIRRMRRDPVPMTPRAWHVCGCNGLPRIVDKTDASERRILVVTFPHSLTESQVDGNFLNRVQAEPNAILAWAVIGAARLLRNGRFTLPPGHHLAAAEIRFGDDWPMIFAHTQVRQAPADRITTIGLRDALTAFAHSRDVEPPVNMDPVIRRVAGVLQDHHGATRRKSNGHPFYEGVSLVLQPVTDTTSPANVDLDDL